MDRAVAYINDNIFIALDIDAISAHVYMSKYYFCRVFKEENGMSPLGFRREFHS